MSTAPVVVVGPGNVGCGVVAAALQREGRPYVLVARNEQRAQDLRQEGVRVRLVSRPLDPDLTLRPDEVLAIDDPSLPELVGAASALFVAVGSGQARTLVPALATALAARPQPLPVLVCDNREGAAEALRSLVAEHVVDRRLRHRFAGVMVDRIANRATSAAGRLVVVEGPGGLHVDRAALGGVLPAAGGLHAVDDFGAHLLRKRYVFSAGHAAAAYLGGHSGHRTLPEVLDDEELVPVVRAAMREGQAGVALRHGHAFAGGVEDVEAMLRRFRSQALADPVERVGRDPRRKLARGDRVIGPALLARAAGVTPSALAVTAAAALTWGCSLDPELWSLRGRCGPRALLARLAALDEQDPFVELVLAGHEVLAGGGSVRQAFEAVGGGRLVPEDAPW